MGNALMVVKRGFSLAKAKVVAYSPEILVGVGAIGLVTTAVLASKRTGKFMVVLDEYKESKEGIKKAIEVSAEGDGDYTGEDARQDTIGACVRLGQGFVSAYWPALATGTVSITANIAALSIMKRRMTALGIAYTAAVSSFAAYRKAVVDKYGEAADRALMYGEETVELIEETEGEDGKKDVKAVEYRKVDKGESAITKFFPESAVFGGAGAHYGDMFARAIENFARLEIESKGYLSLNELHEEVGTYRDLSPAEIAQGQVLGWVRDESIAYDEVFKVKTEKAVMQGQRGLMVEFPAPINLVGYLRGKDKTTK